MYECLARGLSFKVGQGNVLTLGPPLVITRDEMERAIRIIDESLTAGSRLLRQPRPERVRSWHGPVGSIPPSIPRNSRLADNGIPTNH